MADISMCHDIDCPSRMRCYRFTAKMDKWRQSFADFERGDDMNACYDFADNSNSDNAEAEINERIWREAFAR